MQLFVKHSFYEVFNQNERLMGRKKKFLRFCYALSVQKPVKRFLFYV